MGKIRLGSHVKDIINGRTGTAYERVIWLFGCDHIVVLPDMGADKKEIEYGLIMGIPYDEQRLEELDDTKEELILTETRGKQDSFFGKEAEDKVTGFKGIIVGRKVALFGVDQYAIQPKGGKKGSVKKAKWFDEGRLNILGKGVEVEEVTAEKPGGCEYIPTVYA